MSDVLGALGAFVKRAVVTARLFGQAAWRLFFPKKKSKRAPPPEKSSLQNIDTIECRLAVHDAGHAVAAWCCTAVIDIEIATIEAEQGGYVRWRMPRERHADLWHFLVITLAGVAAEAMVYSRSRSEAVASSDFAFARKYAEQLVGVDLPWRDPGGPTIDFQKIYVKPSPSPEVIGVLKAAYRMARHVIRAHGGDYYRVVSMLLTHRTATQRHVERVLGSRIPMRILSLYETKFLLPRSGSQSKS